MTRGPRRLFQALECIHMTAMTNMQSKNNACFSINMTNHPKIPCAQGKKTFHIPRQWFEKGQRAFLMGKYFCYFLLNTLLHGLIKRTKLTARSIRESKRPLGIHGLSRGHFLSKRLPGREFSSRMRDNPHRLFGPYAFPLQHQEKIQALFAHNSFWSVHFSLKGDLNVAQEAVEYERQAWRNPFESICNTIYSIVIQKVKALGCMSLFFLAYSTSSHGSTIASDLMTFFQNVGMASQVTTPGSHKDQAAGYYTGGSLNVRNGVKNAQVATLQMPGFRAGCGGIDLWTGGFSHISSDQIVEMLRNIGSSAASYAFMLAIQTLSPQTYNIMNELNALATQINQTNINSCETAATLLGGMWPKTDQSSKHLCQAMGSQFGAFSDYAAARQGCGANGDRERILSQKSQDPRYKDMFAGEFNLAWKAIQLNAFLTHSPQLSQLFLTLVGSIIVRKNGDNYQVIHLPSHVDRDDVLNGLLSGGSTPVYVCDNDHCLRPTLKQVVIHERSALLRQTQQILDTLVDKIYDDTPLSPEEKDFLNATRLPVYKMLNVVTAFRKGHAPLDIQQYGELIALDILYRYVLEVIDIVHDSVVQLRSIQVDEGHMQRFLDQLRHARERILHRRQSAYQHMDSNLSMIQATQLIEKQLHAMMGSIANENNGL